MYSDKFTICSLSFFLSFSLSFSSRNCLSLGPGPAEQSNTVIPWGGVSRCCGDRTKSQKSLHIVHHSRHSNWQKCMRRLVGLTQEPAKQQLIDNVVCGAATGTTSRYDFLVVPNAPKTKSNKIKGFL